MVGREEGGTTVREGKWEERLREGRFDKLGKREDTKGLDLDKVIQVINKYIN